MYEQYKYDNNNQYHTIRFDLRVGIYQSIPPHRKKKHKRN